MPERTYRYQPNPTELTLSDAANQLGGLISVRNLAVSRNREQKSFPDIITARRERRQTVNRQLGRLYSFFQEIEGKESPTTNIALERYERMLDLLVHPTIDTALTEDVNTLNLQQGVVSLTGSSGNGSALLRTVVGTDSALDQEIPIGSPRRRPDLDLMLISESDINYGTRMHLRQGLNGLLLQRGLSQDANFNLEYAFFTTDEIVQDLQEDPNTMILNEELAGNKINSLFLPLYPKERGERMRRDFLRYLTSLGEQDPEKQNNVIKKLLIFRKTITGFSEKHFEGISDLDDDTIHTVNNYFTDRVMGVFDQLLDKTRKPDASASSTPTPPSS